MDKRKKIGFLHPPNSAMLSRCRFSRCRVKWEIADVNDSSKSVVLTHASPQKRRKVTSRKQNNIHRPLPSASFIRNRFLLRLFLISDYVLENLPFSRRLCDATVYVYFFQCIYIIFQHHVHGVSYPSSHNWECYCTLGCPLFFG